MFPARCEMFEPVLMDNAWQHLNVWCLGLSVDTPHGNISRPVAWLHMTSSTLNFWETRAGWRLLDEELRLTLGGFWDAWCWHFAPDSVRIAHPRRCLEPDESHVSCVFEDPFLRMARTEGMIRREGAAMCSWVCEGMLFQSVPLQFFHCTFEFMHWFHSRTYYLDSKCACLWIL
jgi:hypothetical protein